MAAKIQRCARCSKRLRNGGDDWAVAIDISGEDGMGEVAELYCGACTTTAEHIQRQINDATTDYVWYGDKLARIPKKFTDSRN